MPTVIYSASRDVNTHGCLKWVLQPQSTLPDSENPPASVPIGWDSDENWQRRFWARIMEEKKQRERDILLMKKQRQELEKERQHIAQTRQSIDQQKYDLEAREAKLQSIQLLIPSVKELQAMGVTFDLLIPYLMTVNEKAVTENIDLKTAAYNIVHDFREYRDLESLHKSVEKARQQPEVLQAFTVQKQAAVATVMNEFAAGRFFRKRDCRTNRIRRQME